MSACISQVILSVPGTFDLVAAIFSVSERLSVCQAMGTRLYRRGLEAETTEARTTDAGTTEAQTEQAVLTL